MSQKKRQAMLRRFDTDGDGQLSKDERQAARKAIKEHQRAKPGNASERPAPAPDEQ
jgi:hypothetical protein